MMTFGLGCQPGAAVRRAQMRGQIGCELCVCMCCVCEGWSQKCLYCFYAEQVTGAILHVNFYLDSKSLGT